MHPLERVANESWRNFDKPKAMKKKKESVAQLRQRGENDAALGVSPKSDNKHYLSGYSRQYEREQVATARTEVF